MFGVLRKSCIFNAKLLPEIQTNKQKKRFLMNLHVRPRAIYLTRHGESVFNQLLVGV